MTFRLPNSSAMEAPIRDGPLRPQDSILLLLQSTLCILTIGANLVVLVTIGCTRKLHSVSSALVVNMALCDLGIGIVAMPLILTGIVHGRWPYSKVTCHLTSILTSVLVKGSVWSLAAIALDRYLAINYCLRYSTWSPWRYGGALLVSIWIQAILLGLSPLFSWSTVEVQNVSFTCVVSWRGHLVYGLLSFMMCFILPLFIMSYCYMRIILVARQHARRIEDIAGHSDGNRNNFSTNGAIAAGAMFSVRRLSMLSFPGNVDLKSDNGSFYDNDNNSEGTSEPSTLHLRRDIRATLRLLGLILAFVITWLPYLIMCLNNVFGGYFIQNNPYITTSTYTLGLANSCINPFLYALLSKHFRRASKQLFTRRTSIMLIKNKQDCKSSYTSFLRNLRAPTSRQVNVISGVNQHRNSCSPETTTSDSRPTSALSDISINRKFLDVPRGSFGDSYGFLLPNTVSYPEEMRLSRGRLVGSFSSTGTIEDYYYDRNKANIKIQVDLV